jgi:hypothetical protein
MENKSLILHADSLEREYLWLSEVLETRLKLYFGGVCSYERIEDIPQPDLTDDESPYGVFVRKYHMTVSERIVLLVALAPYLRPQALDNFFVRNTVYDRVYSEFGGVAGTQHAGFIPTGETAIFVLAGENLAMRAHYLALLGEKHYFFRENILKMDTPPAREPHLSGVLYPTPECVTYFQEAGAEYIPRYSALFPARQVTTRLEWEDLVLDPQTLSEVMEIQAWLGYHEQLLVDWNLSKILNSGYKALFYGPPGTGKSLTAALIGKSSGRPVFRIDLSQVISKYIGETEKNLAGVFDRASNSQWILFFDEADALFGKRSDTKDDYAGVVILATNLKANIDEAFLRRFHSVIYFPAPGPEQRRRLWQSMFSPPVRTSPDIDWNQIAAKYEITGGAILNIVRYAALQAIQRGNPEIGTEDILAGIRREMRKEGKNIVS